MAFFQTVTLSSYSPIQVPRLLLQSLGWVFCLQNLPPSCQAHYYLFLIYLLLFIHSHNKYVLSSYYVLGTILGTEYKYPPTQINDLVTTTTIITAILELTFLGEGAQKNPNKYITNQMVENAVGEKKVFSKRNRDCWEEVLSYNGSLGMPCWEGDDSSRDLQEMNECV